MITRSSGLIVHKGLSECKSGSREILFSSRAPNQIAEPLNSRADAFGVHVERVKKYRAHPYGPRRQSVVRVRVAYERGLSCFGPEPFEREMKDCGVWLPAPDEVRVNGQVEETVE